MPACRWAERVSPNVEVRIRLALVGQISVRESIEGWSLVSSFGAWLEDWFGSWLGAWLDGMAEDLPWSWLAVWLEGMTEGLPWSWLEGWFRGDVTAVSFVVTVDPFVVTVDSFVTGVRIVSCDSPGCGLINPRKITREWRIVYWKDAGLLGCMAYRG